MCRCSIPGLEVWSVLTGLVVEASRNNAAVECGSVWTGAVVERFWAVVVRPYWVRSPWGLWGSLSAFVLLFWGNCAIGTQWVGHRTGRWGDSSGDSGWDGSRGPSFVGVVCHIICWGYGRKLSK